MAGGNKFPRAAATVTNVGYARLKGEKNTWLAGLHEVTGYGNLRMTNGQKATLIGLEIPNYVHTLRDLFHSVKGDFRLPSLRAKICILCMHACLYNITCPL